MSQPARVPSRRRAVAALTIASLLSFAAATWGDAPAGAAPAPAVATSTTSTSSTSTTAPGTAAVTATPAPLANPAVPTRPAKRLGRMGSLKFPMQPTPTCKILDNFADSRSGGRSHEGVDIGGDLGQEVYAVADGVLTKQYVDGEAGTSLSGNGWRLTLTDKTFYFYAHLSAFADGLEMGDSVKKGQLLGYVGDTGNPTPGSYHLHFEVHPQGGAAVNPLTLLEIPPGCSII